MSYRYQILPDNASWEHLTMFYPRIKDGYWKPEEVNHSFRKIWCSREAGKTSRFVADRTVHVH